MIHSLINILNLLIFFNATEFTMQSCVCGWQYSNLWSTKAAVHLTGYDSYRKTWCTVEMFPDGLKESSLLKLLLQNKTVTIILMAFSSCGCPIPEVHEMLTWNWKPRCAQPRVAVSSATITCSFCLFIYVCLTQLLLCQPQVFGSA